VALLCGQGLQNRAIVPTTYPRHRVIEFGKNDTMMDKVLKIYDKQNQDACYVSESFIMSA
jgi:hypothetical protein